jgi:hypothetical protein
MLTICITIFPKGVIHDCAQILLDEAEQVAELEVDIVAPVVLSTVGGPRHWRIFGRTRKPASFDGKQPKNAKGSGPPPPPFPLRTSPLLLMTPPSK